jgi:hypothetical protein
MICAIEDLEVDYLLLEHLRTVVSHVADGAIGLKHDKLAAVVWPEEVRRRDVGNLLGPYKSPGPMDRAIYSCAGLRAETDQRRISGSSIQSGRNVHRALL